MTAMGIYGQSATFTGTGFTITDGGGRVPASCSTVNVSGLSVNTTITNIAFNGFNHTWIGDLEMRLYPPAAAVPPSTTGTTVISSPPDGRGCNFAGGTYNFNDLAASSLDAATAGCTSATNIPAGSYRTSTYGGGTVDGPTTLLSTSPGTLTPAQANGNWLVCAFDFATPDGGSATSTSLTFASVGPSAAGTSVSGRVTTADGRGIINAIVQLTGTDGITRNAYTSSFGYFRFDEVPSGSTYVIGVASKRFAFTPRTISVDDELVGVDFVAAEQ